MRREELEKEILDLSRELNFHSEMLYSWFEGESRKKNLDFLDIKVTLDFLRSSARLKTLADLYEKSYSGSESRKLLERIKYQDF